MNVLALTILATTVAAANPIDPEVAAWVSSLEALGERTAPVTQLCPENTRVKWRLSRTFVPPPQEVAELRQRVTDRPEHPDRRRLESYALRQKGQDFYDRYLIVGERSAFRLGTDAGDPAIKGYFDKTIRPDLSWAMSAQALQIVPAAAKADQPNFANAAR